MAGFGMVKCESPYLREIAFGHGFTTVNDRFGLPLDESRRSPFRPTRRLAECPVFPVLIQKQTG
jgi:hypothetical protein